MSIEGVRYNIAPLLWNGLSVTQCGRTVCSPGHAVPKRFYGHYSLHFVESGAGRFHTGGITYRLKEGEGFLISPDQPCCYTADEADPWRYTYVSFTGPDLPPVLREAGLLSSPVFSYAGAPRTDALLSALLKEAAGCDPSGLLINGVFLEILGLLAGCTRHEEPGEEPEKYVAQAVSYMEDNYADKISVQEVADRVGINRSYLHRLFIRSRGVSPSRYLLNYRLARARDMMAHREFSLTEIALAVGFCDAAHFSRSFAAHYGVPPRLFRENMTE